MLLARRVRQRRRVRLITSDRWCAPGPERRVEAKRRMQTERGAIGWALWGVIGLLLVALTVAVFALQWRLRPEPLPVFGQISDFQLTNQLSEPVTAATLRDQVWLANIIFTRCPGICPVMTRNFAQVQEKLPSGAPVRLVSLTADPEHDTVEVMERFAQAFGADPVRWLFLTGPKEELYRFALEDLKLTAMESDPEQVVNLADLFIHSGTFVLIDGQGRLRAVYDGTEPDAPQRALGGIQRLLRER
jgi:protein SCO1